MCPSQEKHERELAMRRDILVNGIRAFHPTDNAWLVPGMAVFRTGDSCDMMGLYGELVRDHLRAGDLRLWTSGDHRNERWAYQIFKVDTNERLPVQVWQSAGAAPTVSEQRKVWFPDTPNGAPWGRLGMQDDVGDSGPEFTFRRRV